MLRVAVMLALTAALIAPIILFAKKGVHKFEGSCENCHVSLKEAKMFVRSIDSLCADCHRSIGLSHPTGSKPSMPMPEGFSLDWTGRMTCATCHDIHGEAKYLLRSGTTGREFCLLCHQLGEGKHGGVVATAHSSSTRKLKGLEVTDANNPLDRETMTCLSCHDSTIGGAARATVGSGVWSHNQGASHPIGTSYSSAYNRKRAGLHPLSRVNPSLRFYNGKVGCGTCHNPYSKEPHILAMKAKDLCNACHNL
jgi:predicted CXXCH cytochrome family protein